MMRVIDINVINAQNLYSVSMVCCYVTFGPTILDRKEFTETRVPSG